MGEKIEELLKCMTDLYSMNCNKGEIQFIIDGKAYYFVLSPEHCLVKQGESEKPLYSVITSYDCLHKISGGYISPMKAMLKGDFKVKGNLLSFITGFKRTFDGNSKSLIPDYCRDYPQHSYDVEKIRHVVVIGCSPREKGATNLMLDRLILGMEAAGAKVDRFQAAKMKIAPCIGCFHCWEHKKCCHSDDMEQIIESFGKADLVVWATPIYFYNCTTLMKQVIDRFFVGVDSHFMLDDKGEHTHPRKLKFPPYQFLLTTAGYQDASLSKPVIDSLKRMPIMKLVGTICRGMAPALIEDSFSHIKKDQVIETLERAGRELVEKKRLSRKTRKVVEQRLIEDKKFHAIINSRAQNMGDAVKADK